jgi:hypothetical protein
MKSFNIVYLNGQSVLSILVGEDMVFYGSRTFIKMIGKFTAVLVCILMMSSGAIGLFTPKDGRMIETSMPDMDIEPMGWMSPVWVWNSTEWDATGRNYQRTLVREADDTLVTVFPDNGEIWISNSTDDGATWSTPQNVSNTTAGSTLPAIATNGTATFIVWIESYDVKLRYTTDSGLTWNPPLDQAPTDIYATGGANQQAREVSITTNGDQMVYVLFTRSEWSNEVVHFRRSTDVGQTWQATLALTNTWDEREGPTVAAEGA